MCCECIVQYVHFASLKKIADLPSFSKVSERWESFNEILWVLGGIRVFLSVVFHVSRKVRVSCKFIRGFI